MSTAAVGCSVWNTSSCCCQIQRQQIFRILCKPCKKTFWYIWFQFYCFPLEILFFELLVWRSCATRTWTNLGILKHISNNQLLSDHKGISSKEGEFTNASDVHILFMHKICFIFSSEALVSKEEETCLIFRNLNPQAETQYVFLSTTEITQSWICNRPKLHFYLEAVGGDGTTLVRSNIYRCSVHKRTINCNSINTCCSVLVLEIITGIIMLTTSWCHFFLIEKW